MPQFHYVGRAGGGRGRRADEVGVRMPGGLCLAPIDGGFRVVAGSHAHGPGTPCAVVGRGREVIDVPAGMQHFGVPVASLLERASPVGGRVLYERVGGR